jgi:Zn-dependent peptidase ImmA (M78 family)
MLPNLESGMGNFIRQRMWDSQKDPSDNIRKIIDSFNIKLEYVDNYPGIITKFDVPIVIKLSRYSSPFRTNWNMAHMLGHILYEQWEIYNNSEFYCKDKGHPSEILAEDFAFDLMLPDEEFKEYCDKVNGNLNLLGGHLLVPRDKITLKLRHMAEDMSK